MRKDSELFLKKLLEYRKKVRKDNFEVTCQDYKEIPSIETAIFDILEDLIKNNCLTSQSRVTDLDGHISINLTLDGIAYFDEAKTKENTLNYIFNVSGGQVNFAKDNGTINAFQNNSDNRDFDIKDKGAKFHNNKKQDYINIWNSRLFLHQDNDERPLTLADTFIMPDLKIEGCDKHFTIYYNETADRFIKRFIQLEKNSTMLIRGVPGIGKTTITSWIAQEYQTDEKLIILRFRDWECDDLEQGILGAICNMLICRKTELNNHVLVLDGFDEMKSLEKSNSLLNEFFNDIHDLDNTKIIITSRSGYINSSNFDNKIMLLPFDISRIQAFYQNITNDVLNKNEIDNQNLDILGVPVILYMAIMSNIDITKKASKAELYNRIFAKKGGIFDRFSEYDKGSQILRDSNNIKIYLDFLKEVAYKMFEKRDLILQKEEYSIPELKFQRKSVSVLEFPIKHLFESTECKIEFIHKSIYEYFVSEYIISSMNGAIKVSKEELAGTFGYLLKKNALSKEILEFMSYKIKSSELKDMFNTVYEVFLLMLQDGMTYNAKEHYKNIMECEMCIFANMLEIIHLWDNSYLIFDELLVRYLRFNRNHPLNLKNTIIRLKKENSVNGELDSSKGIYLGDIDLSGANLSGVDFRKADLKRANLEGVNLRRANFERVNLRKANLREANFERANLRRADLAGADLRKANLKLANVESSIWFEYDIKKWINQLKEAYFNTLCIIVDNREKRIRRSELFPDENS